MSYNPEYFYMNPSPLTPPTFTPQQCMPQEPCTLRVAGTGRVTVQPDLAEVFLGVSTDNMSLATAQAENAAAITAVINALTRAGVAANDIATQSYTITPLYDFVEGQQVFRGYRVVHTLRVTVRDTTRVGQIIDAAVAAGANFVNDIRFTVANPTVFYQQALSRAIDDAITKAMTIGNRLQLNISPIPIRVVEVIPGGTPIEPALLKTAEAATPIQPGQYDVIAQVEVVFAYSCR